MDTGGQCDSGVGSAMDLAIGAKKAYVMMEHLTKKGESKIVQSADEAFAGRHGLTPKRACSAWRPPRRAAREGLVVLRDQSVADDDPRVDPNGGARSRSATRRGKRSKAGSGCGRPLQRGNGRYALCTIRIGVRQGNAVVLERV